MKYSFKQQVYINWKGQITESLAKYYVTEVLIPKLEKEGWDNVLFLHDLPFWRVHDKDLWYRLDWIRILDKGIYLNQELLDNCKKIGGLLEHSPDGFLLKLGKTGEVKLMKDIVAELGRGKWKLCDVDGEIEFSTEELDETKEIPIVNGEIEVVEVKSDKGKLTKVQKEEYSNLLRNGYPLRLIHVRIISFVKNQFEVEQKLFRTATRLCAP